MCAKIITRKKGYPSLRFRVHPKNYLVLTEKGVEFVEKWFHTERRVPPHLTKLYQLLLRMVSFGGVISMQLALRSGYDQRVISEAVSQEYVVLTQMARKPTKEVQRRIIKMVGEPPKEIYV